MADIKTRDTSKGTIKTINKAKSCHGANEESLCDDER